ncbi:hypothetical protein [Streptomyces sp. C36]|uniref:DUF7878 domain-containing protein n=1 Tax=Streptomyces sp. C36 TaxID=3237122 RepID=UPI0034C5D834
MLADDLAERLTLSLWLADNTRSTGPTPDHLEHWLPVRETVSWEEAPDGGGDGPVTPSCDGAAEDIRAFDADRSAWHDSVRLSAFGWPGRAGGLRSHGGRAVRFVCRNFGLSDLPRRGLAPHEAPLDVLLLDIEAELSIWEDGRVVWSEEAFPVAELAYHLALWLQSPDAGQEGFELDSMQADLGLLQIGSSDEGWRVGSILTPVFWTAPIAWDVLVAEIKQFVTGVRGGVAAMDIEPAFLPEL